MPRHTVFYSMTKKLLLISNSTLHGSGYLQHCEDQIQQFLGERIKTVLFIPYARPGGMSHDDYTIIAQQKFLQMGYKLTGIHSYEDPKEAIKKTDAIFTGGGNTFVLLNELYKNKLIKPIQQAVDNGTPYIGTSAGSNIATPNIKTTNDMPILYPPSFDSLHLVPFNLNPHYIDTDPTSTHMGETREKRIQEFHHYNMTPVIGLREGALLHIEGDVMKLLGSTGARLFLKDKEPVEYKSGSDLSFLF